MDIENKKALETRIKFLTCFDLFEEHLNRVSESYYSERGIDVKAFKEMLNNYHMTEYADLLLSTIWSQEHFEKYANSLDEQIIRDSEHLKSLTETLHFILSNDTGKNVSLTIYKSRNKKLVSNKDVVDTIIKSLFDDFKRKQFNLTNLTVEEAEQEIDKEWIDQWINEQSYNSSIDNDFVDIMLIKDNAKMIKSYADSHYRAREVNLEFLSANYQKFTCPRRPGAKAKNIYKSITYKHLSYLKRIDKFLTQHEIKDIEEFPISNKDCRFIHDCMVLFNLIDDKTVNKINDTKPENYIRTILNEKSFKSHNSLVDKPRVNINDLRSRKL